MAFPRSPAYRDGVDTASAATLNDLEARAKAYVDGAVPTGMVTAPVTNGPLAAGGSSLVNVPAFQASTAYPAGYVVQQAGALYSRITAGTSGVSWAADSSNWTAVSSAGSSGAQDLAPTAVKTANYTAAPADFVPVDASGGSVTITLPTAPADRTRIGVKVIAVAGTNTVTLARGGADVFNLAGAASSLVLNVLFQGALLQYQASTSIWYVTSLDAPLNVPSGAAKLGTDGKVGGPGGSPVAGATVSTARLVAAGSLGTSYTLTVNGQEDVLLTGTLNSTNCTLTFSGLPAGGPASVTVELKQDATGSRTITFPVGTTFPAGAIALSVVPNAVDLLTFVWDGSTLMCFKANPTAASAPGVAVSLWAPTSAVAETFPRTTRMENCAVFLGGGTTNRPHLTGGMVIPAGKTISHVSCVTGSTGSSGLTHSWVAVVSRDRSTILSKSNDITTEWGSATVRTFDLATPITVGVDTAVAIVICVAAATTLPALTGALPGVNSLGASGMEPMIAAVLPSGISTPASFTSASGATANGNAIYYYAT